MKGYAFGYLWDVNLCSDIEDYLNRIEATLAPFGGVFAVHGGTTELREGDLPKGDMVLIEFPDIVAAKAWYDSAAYQAIKPLRTAHSQAHVMIAEGVAAGHRAIAVLQA
jgi:uncharacterized protein (DUF1330 family)